MLYFPVLYNMSLLLVIHSSLYLFANLLEYNKIQDMRDEWWQLLSSASLRYINIVFPSLFSFLLQAHKDWWKASSEHGVRGCDLSPGDDPEAL